MKNKLIKKENYYIMPVTRKNGDEFEIMVSEESMSKLEKHNYSWHIGWNKRKGKYYVTSTVHLGYVNGKWESKSIYLHRYLLDAKSGDYVDHINGNTMDNRLENLRITTNQINSLNCKGANRNAKSGVRNVHWNEKRKCWMVQFWNSEKKNNKLIGNYKNLEDAIRVAEKNRKLYYNI